MTFECHVTIEPVFGEARATAARMADKYGFKLAKLYMENGEASRKDTFMTGHSEDQPALAERSHKLIVELKQNFVVRRYKIEHILVDSRRDNDPWRLL